MCGGILGAARVQEAWEIVDVARECWLQQFILVALAFIPRQEAASSARDARSADTRSDAGSARQGNKNAVTRATPSSVDLADGRPAGL